MPPSRSNPALEEFNRNLSQSQKILDQILNDFQKNGVSFHEINSEVKRLITSVKELTSAFDEQVEKYQDLQIKVVLLEHKVSELKKFADDLQVKNITFMAQDKASKAQITVAVISGFVALMVSIITVIFKFAG